MPAPALTDTGALTLPVFLITVDIVFTSFTCRRGFFISLVLSFETALVNKTQQADRADYKSNDFLVVFPEKDEFEGMSKEVISLVESM